MNKVMGGSPCLATKQVLDHKEKSPLGQRDLSSLWGEGASSHGSRPLHSSHEKNECQDLIPDVLRYLQEGDGKGSD